MDDGGTIDVDTLDSVPSPQLDHFPLCIVWCPIPLLTYVDIRWKALYTGVL